MILLFSEVFNLLDSVEERFWATSMVFHIYDFYFIFSDDLKLKKGLVLTKTDGIVGNW